MNRNSLLTRKMKKIYTDIEKLERYHRGICSEREVMETELELGENEKFRNLSDDMELMLEGIARSARKSSIEDKLEKLQIAFAEEENREKSNHPKPSQSKTISMGIPGLFGRYKLGIAASIVLLLAAWIVFLPASRTATPDELFRAHFDTYENLNGKTRSTEVLDDRAKAYEAYDLGNYALAIKLFDQVLQNSDNPLMDQFYYGNAALASGDTQSAIEAFTIVERAGTGLAMESKWYLGLSYLKSKDIERAKKCLTEVQNSGKDPNRASAAEDILNQLN